MQDPAQLCKQNLKPQSPFLLLIPGADVSGAGAESRTKPSLCLVSSVNPKEEPKVVNKH